MSFSCRESQCVPAAGGRYPSEQACRQYCGNYLCDADNGCTVAPDDTRGQYATFRDCIQNGCFGYVCDLATGKDPYKCLKGVAGQYTMFHDKGSCEAQCVSTEKKYSCKGGACVEDETSLLTLGECANLCGGYDCVQGQGCVKVGPTDSPQFQDQQSCLHSGCHGYSCDVAKNACSEDPDAPGHPNKDACEAFCGGWSCTGTGASAKCVAEKGGLGRYKTQQECLRSCNSYACDKDGGCVPAGADVRGEFPSKDDCVRSAKCSFFSCDSSRGCYVDGSGAFKSLEACQATCPRYQCVGGKCTAQRNGQFGSLRSCQAAGCEGGGTEGPSVGDIVLWVGIGAGVLGFVAALYATMLCLSA